MESRSAVLTFITPEMAISMLDSANTGNRRLRAWWAEAMASAIRRGEWVTTHQGVAFTVSKRLIDGQHRLKAIALSNIGVWMYVFSGVPDEAFKVIDIGVKRTMADSTDLPKKTAEVSRFLGVIRFGGCVSTSQVRELADAGISEIHGRLIDYCNTSKSICSSAPVRAAACLLVMDGYDEQVVFNAYRGMVHQHYEQLPSSCNAFLKQVNDGKLSASKHHDLLARALKALNPNNFQLSKIQVSEADCSASATYARSLISKAMMK